MGVANIHSLWEYETLFSIVSLIINNSWWMANSWLNSVTWWLVTMGDGFYSLVDMGDEVTMSGY